MNEANQQPTSTENQPLEHEQRIVAEVVGNFDVHSDGNGAPPDNWSAPTWEQQFKRNLGEGGNGGVKYKNINTVDPVFHNELTDDRVIQREQPHHRRMLELAMQGFKPAEIGTLTGYKAGTVSTVLRQPWAKRFMVERMKQDAASEAGEFLKNELLPSLEDLKSIAENPLTPVPIVEKIRQSFIDRVLGKATQPIVTAKVEPKNLTDEQLAAIAGRAVVPDPNGSPTSSNGTTEPTRN